ncbi:DUF3572 family protein [Sphingomonas sp.]|jgi:2-hydroxychromene-2-carboxylate isomerase|uniref:DUF3572 family protein n=1 Tax=Sphingomonas sp. TaxID=28214 RepID=UPI002D7E1836|nr:DUF3572 family protein [Sphingomonas sp.]HEU0043218.1 DUF3572 family protein [Sphingomonas sp.]
MRRPDTIEDAPTLALRALVWTLAEPERAQRVLAVTGIDPADLRARLSDPAVLAASLQFLLAHEADLVACAAGLDVPPTALARAAEALDA